MKMSRQIKPISYLKAHAAEILRNLGEAREPLIITQNGEAKVVIQDIQSYEQMQETMAQACSELERNGEAAERELLAWKKVAFIRDKVGEIFRGVISGVAPFGLFVQLEENLVEGLVKVEMLGEERFEYTDRKMELRGNRSGRRYRLGDRVEVRVVRVDTILKRVDFALAGTTEARRRRKRGRRGKAASDRSPAVV